MCVQNVLRNFSHKHNIGIACIIARAIIQLSLVWLVNVDLFSVTSPPYTPRRNPGYRDTPARENNKKFNFELIN